MGPHIYNYRDLDSLAVTERCSDLHVYIVLTLPFCEIQGLTRCRTTLDQPVLLMDHDLKRRSFRKTDGLCIDQRTRL